MPPWLATLRELVKQSDFVELTATLAATDDSWSQPIKDKLDEILLATTALGAAKKPLPPPKITLHQAVGVLMKHGFTVQEVALESGYAGHGVTMAVKVKVSGYHDIDQEVVDAVNAWAGQTPILKLKPHSFSSLLQKG